MCALALLKRSPKRRSAAPLPGAKRAPMPGFIEPCDPTLREDAPRGPEWIHEIKIDGYRAQLHIRGGEVKVYSRKGYDWTEQFGQVARAAAALAGHEPDHRRRGDSARQHRAARLSGAAARVGKAGRRSPDP